MDTDEMTTEEKNTLLKKNAKLTAIIWEITNNRLRVTYQTDQGPKTGIPAFIELIKSDGTHHVYIQGEGNQSWPVSEVEISQIAIQRHLKVI